MLVVPLLLIAVFGGIFFYRRTQRAGRELELRRIESDLAALSRRRRDGAENALVPIPAKIRRR